MELEDVAAAFAFIRALQADDIDTTCAVADDTGPELHRLLLDVAARVIIPVTAADDHDGEPCAHSFLAAALGRLLLEMLGDSACLAGVLGIADTITPLHRQHPHHRARRRRRSPAPAGGHGDAPGDGGAPGAPHHRVAVHPGRRWCGAHRVRTTAGRWPRGGTETIRPTATPSSSVAPAPPVTTVCASSSTPAHRWAKLSVPGSPTDREGRPGAAHHLVAGGRSKPRPARAALALT
ncbi:hypothetical protein [Streptomyces sp. NPDC092952]|uniref:hypothetical protein n=1 Tax=Streptomyces sp. NPDC092952 TaxID=3366018 RepID=UPI003805A909